MSNLTKVKMIVDTSSNKAGDIRELNAERAQAWVEAGWAEYVESYKLKKSKPKRDTEEVN